MMKFLLQIYFQGLYYFIKNRYFRTFLWLTVRYCYTKRYTEELIKFRKFKINVADVKSTIWQYYEIFFKGYYEFNSIKDEPIIIDCGSNIGLSVINFKIQYPKAKIYAFEPDKTIYNLLVKNLKINNLNDIIISNNAVWINNEVIPFKEEGADGGQISLNDHSKIMVKGINFKEFLSQFESIDFLKIDIEGAETEILPFIVDELSKVDNIFIEFHSYKTHKQKLNDVINSISQNGHRVYVESSKVKFKPFLNKSEKSDLDLQLNIFAYKN